MQYENRSGKEYFVLVGEREIAGVWKEDPTKSGALLPSHLILQENLCSARCLAFYMSLMALLSLLAFLSLPS